MISNNGLNELIHSQEPLPDLPMVVDVGGDRYHMGDRHLNLGYNNYKDFINIFGKERETERILRQYLYLRVGEQAGIEFYGDQGKKDKTELVKILKKRLAQLTQNKNFTSNQLNKVKLQRIYANIQKILVDIGDSEMVANTMSEEFIKNKEALVELSKDSDRIFQLILEIIWYLFHPDRVPKDVEQEWASLIHKMSKLSVGDLVKSIKQSGSVSNNSFNYFKKIRLNQMAEKDALPNALEEAKAMVLEVEEETSDDKAKEMVSKLLQLLETKRILQSNDPANLNAEVIKKADKWIMSKPFTTKSVLFKSGDVPDTPFWQSGGEGFTKDFIQLTKSMYSAMTPLFEHFRIMYDPIYSMLESGTSAVNITHPIILLHLCTQLQKKVSKEGAYQYGIYRISGIPKELLSFIKRYLNRTKAYLGALEPKGDDAPKRQFVRQLFSLPRVRLSSLITDRQNSAYKDPKVISYLQFFVMNENFTFPQEFAEFIHDKNIAKEDQTPIYDAMKQLFTPNDLYIVCTSAEDASLLGQEVNSSTTNIPMKNYIIDYRTINPNQPDFKGSIPKNYFNDKEKESVFFEQMVKQTPFVTYNDAELALSILIAFKEHMPK